MVYLEAFYQYLSYHSINRDFCDISKQALIFISRLHVFLSLVYDQNTMQVSQ